MARANRSWYSLCRRCARLTSSVAGVMRDLVCLVADKNMESGFRALLARHHAIGCAPFSYEVFSHPWHDSGCLGDCHQFLSPLKSQFRYALVAFDREGCGDFRPLVEITNSVSARMGDAGWAKRHDVIVLDPELENWVWSASPHVASALGWEGLGSLQDWLQTRNLWPPNAPKPPRPKEALEAALRQTRKVRSSAIYSALGSSVSLVACQDSSFLRLRATLRGWFPPGPLG